jgi:hypothetical protein
MWIRLLRLEQFAYEVGAPTSSLAYCKYVNGWDRCLFHSRSLLPKVNKTVADPYRFLQLNLGFNHDGA